MYTNDEYMFVYDYVGELQLFSYSFHDIVVETSYRVYSSLYYFIFNGL